jgi:hypothetical protein
MLNPCVRVKQLQSNNYVEHIPVNVICIQRKKHRHAIYAQYEFKLLTADTNEISFTKYSKQH